MATTRKPARPAKTHDEKLREEVAFLKQENLALDARATKAENELEAKRKGLEREVAANGNLSTENDRLRDECRMLTVEVARHEGYRERVQEFDPVSPKQHYHDELRVHHQERESVGYKPMRPSPVDQVGMDFANSAGGGSAVYPRWHRRRG